MSTEGSEAGFNLDVKQAVDIATKYALSLYGTTISNLLLEEVELAADNTWHVTLSYTVVGEPMEVVHQIGDLFGSPRVHPRHYKEFLIEAHTGKVRSMKIRKNA